MVTCTNCGASDFVWSDGLRAGLTGAGGLTLRGRKEAGLGVRICRSCGHADLFLRDTTLMRSPHLWREGEFVPITIPARPKARPSPSPSPAVPARAVSASPTPSGPAAPTATAGSTTHPTSISPGSHPSPAPLGNEPTSSEAMHAPFPVHRPTPELAPPPPPPPPEPFRSVPPAEMAAEATPSSMERTPAPAVATPTGGRSGSATSGKATAGPSRKAKPRRKRSSSAAAELVESAADAPSSAPAEPSSSA